MNDATGMPQTVVLLGGTSEIGLAVLRELAGRRLEAAVLAGRDLQALATAAAELAAAGVRSVELAEWDASDPVSCATLARRSREAIGDVDLVVMAAGDLGSAELAELDAGRVFDMMAANVVGPAAALLEFAKAMAAQGAGRLVVLSSVAGLRVRRANFVYGAGKAGLDGFALGLHEALRGSGVGVMVVRPGFVRTKMTTGRPEAPLSVDPDQVASSVVQGLEQSSPVVYVPPPLRYLFAVLRTLPAALWRRLPG